MADQANNSGEGTAAAPAADVPDEFALAIAEATASSQEPPADAAGELAADPVPQSEADTPPVPTGAGANDRAAGNEPPADTASTDIWNDAPEHLRKAHEQVIRDADYRVKSAHGRLSALDKQLAALKANNGTQDPPPAQAPKASADGNADDGLSTLLEEYPEIVGPLIAQNKLLNDRISAVEAPVQALTQGQAQAQVNEQLTILETAHPDWLKYAHDDRFPGWLESKPLAFREAAARANTVEDGAEAAWLLGQFKADIGALAPEPLAPNPEPKPDVLGQRRARQLAAGRDGGRSSAPVTSGVPDDFDAAVIHRSQQLERQGRGPVA